MIYTINNCIRAFGYTNFDKLIADMGSVDNLREYVRANGYADIAVCEDTELLLVDVNGKTWHTGCYGAQLGPEPDYLCFTSTGDSTVAMQQKGTPNTSVGKVIQYRLNDGQWQTWDLHEVSLHNGDKMYLKSDDEIPLAEYTYTYKYFIMSGSISASGNIMSLLNFSDTVSKYGFNNLFLNCTTLTTARELPATTLNMNCYRFMFKGCTSLVQAPTLPATTLSTWCYESMFMNCTSLTQAPELQATSLRAACYANMFNGCTLLTQAPELPATDFDGATGCYACMFEGCTSLVHAPELPATTYMYDSCYSSMFAGCTSLVQAPELPATSLGEGCYANMFKDCTSLVQAPELPATMLNIECYAYMFGGCTSLVNVPTILPATTLKYRCYKQMFYNCTSLTTAPALPATILAEECYNEMFNRCTSLTQTPELPATTLAQYCYTYMFNGCTSLTQVPSLPATTLVQGCYTEMFMNCTSLTQAPELLATTLAPYCYVEMFSGCSNLNYVKAMFTDISAAGCLNSWLNNVSPTGTFIKSKDATWTNEQAGIPTGWTVQTEGGVTPEPEPVKDYLCFTSTGDSTVAMHQEGTPDTSANKVIQYKLNNGQWQTWDLSAVALSDGDKMYLKSDDEIHISEHFSTYKQFVMTGSIAASGNIMSLLNFSDTVTFSGFIYLFSGCTSLTTAPELPATTLEQDCYESIFDGCTSLTTAPALPATTLADYCYTSMFYGCTSLTTAPALPATTLKTLCYNRMFGGCTSLTTAPELPATTLVDRCYNLMFRGCTNLNYVKAMFTDIPDAEYLSEWLADVSQTGTFVKNSAATWTNEQAKIPTGWTVQTASPDK